MRGGIAAALAGLALAGCDKEDAEMENRKAEAPHFLDALNGLARMNK